MNHVITGYNGQDMIILNTNTGSNAENLNGLFRTLVKLFVKMVSLISGLMMQYPEQSMILIFVILMLLLLKRSYNKNLGSIKSKFTETTVTYPEIEKLKKIETKSELNEDGQDQQALVKARYFRYVIFFLVFVLFFCCCRYIPGFFGMVKGLALRVLATLKKLLFSLFKKGSSYAGKILH